MGFGVPVSILQLLLCVVMVVNSTPHFDRSIQFAGTEKMQNDNHLISDYNVCFILGSIPSL